MRVFNNDAMKKTVLTMVMAGAVSCGLGAQEIGEGQLSMIRESCARSPEDVGRMNAI